MELWMMIVFGLVMFSVAVLFLCIVVQCVKICADSYIDTSEGGPIVPAARPIRARLPETMTDL